MKNPLCPVGLETGRPLAEIAFLEEKARHVFFDERNRARIGSIDAVFVDDSGQPLQPLLPAFGGDVVIDALAQLTRMGRGFKAFGFAVQDYALNSVRHSIAPVGGLG